MSNVKLSVIMSEAEIEIYNAVRDLLIKDLGDVVEKKGVFMTLLWDYYVDKNKHLFVFDRDEEE